MTTTLPPRPLPLPFVLAVLAPSFLLGLLEVLRELGFPLVRVDWELLVLLWLLTTVPTLLVVQGLRRLPAMAGRTEDDPEMRAAFEALARAESLAGDSARALARMDEHLSARSPGELTRDTPPMPQASRRSRRLTALLLVAFIVLGAGIAFAFSQIPEGVEKVHIHSNFAVYVDGTRVAYDDQAFDLSQRGRLRAHLHAPDGDLMHIEGPAGLTLGEFFNDALDADLRQDSLRLDGAVHGGRLLSTDVSQRLRLFVAGDGGDDWIPVVTIPSYVPRDHDRILLTFGVGYPQDIGSQQASVSRIFPAAG